MKNLCAVGRDDNRYGPRCDEPAVVTWVPDDPETGVHFAAKWGHAAEVHLCQTHHDHIVAHDPEAMEGWHPQGRAA